MGEWLGESKAAADVTAPEAPVLKPSVLLLGMHRKRRSRVPRNKDCCFDGELKSS